MVSIFGTASDDKNTTVMAFYSKEVVNWLLALLGLAGLAVPLGNTFPGMPRLPAIIAGHGRALTMRRLLHSPGLFVI